MAGSVGGGVLVRRRGASLLGAAVLAATTAGAIPAGSGASAAGALPDPCALLAKVHTVVSGTRQSQVSAAGACYWHLTGGLYVQIELVVSLPSYTFVVGPFATLAATGVQSSLTGLGPGAKLIEGYTTGGTSESVWFHTTRTSISINALIDRRPGVGTANLPKKLPANVAWLAVAKSITALARQLYPLVR